MHSDAPTAADTDWSQIARAVRPAARDRADSGRRARIARSRVAELDGPEPALAAVDELDLDQYHLFHATRADLLARVGR